MQKYLELLKNQIILDIKERLCYRINLISDLALFKIGRASCRERV